MYCFGLPHPPGCEQKLPSCDQGALMWGGYSAYPDTYLRADEKQQLDRVRSILSLLRAEMKELRAFWDRGDEEHVVRFQKLHRNVYAALEELKNPQDKDPR